VRVTADRLVIIDGSRISAVTFGSGDAGNLSISAGEMYLSGDGSAFFTGLATQANADSAGQGGDLSVTADRLVIRDGAQISAATFASGDAGNLVIRVEEQLTINRAGIATAAVSDAAGGGSITIETPGTVTLVGSGITTSVAGGDRNAGNITLTTPLTLVMLNGSGIRANAFEGAGGNVRIVTDNLLQHPDGVISASSERGVDGEISIDTTEADLSTGLLALGGTFLVDPTLPTPCGVYDAASVSTFTLGAGGLPAAPDAFLSGDYLDVPASAQTVAGRFFLGSGCGS